jgi:hypothetical protein
MSTRERILKAAEERNEEVYPADLYRDRQRLIDSYKILILDSNGVGVVVVFVIAFQVEIVTHGDFGGAILSPEDAEVEGTEMVVGFSLVLRFANFWRFPTSKKGVEGRGSLDPNLRIISRKP